MSQGSKHKPTDETKAQVAALSGFGVRQDEISMYLGISEPTLRKHYREELDVGSIRSNVQVARSLFNNAIGGNVTAQIFWLKARAAWIETSEVRQTGPDGGAIQHEHSDATGFEGLEDDELLELNRLNKKARDAARQRNRQAGG